MPSTPTKDTMTRIMALRLKWSIDCLLCPWTTLPLQAQIPPQKIKTLMRT
ncbi:Di-copper centre-containing [Penicillium camemberti]|uniref:Di-copper centre-containing n=1 Tax=Penicillium camemberti (strain FM 013) TaxID=1429867 RepID=A0A0G4PWA7_PENC3|nr:Di-copper centre-containing [Penicillium camemberti]